MALSGNVPFPDSGSLVKLVYRSATVNLSLYNLCQGASDIGNAVRLAVDLKSRTATGHVIFRVDLKPQSTADCL